MTLFSMAHMPRIFILACALLFCIGLGKADIQHAEAELGLSLVSLLPLKHIPSEFALRLPSVLTFMLLGASLSWYVRSRDGNEASSIAYILLLTSPISLLVARSFSADIYASLGLLPYLFFANKTRSLSLRSILLAVAFIPGGIFFLQGIEGVPPDVSRYAALTVTAMLAFIARIHKPKVSPETDLALASALLLSAGALVGIPGFALAAQAMYISVAARYLTETAFTASTPYFVAVSAALGYLCVSSAATVLPPIWDVVVPTLVGSLASVAVAFILRQQKAPAKPILYWHLGRAAVAISAVAAVGSIGLAKVEKTGIRGTFIFLDEFRPTGVVFLSRSPSEQSLPLRFYCAWKDVPIPFTMARASSISDWGRFSSTYPKKTIIATDVDSQSLNKLLDYRDELGTYSYFRIFAPEGITAPPPLTREI